MGRSKSSEFNTKQNKIAALAKAMAHPARVAILEYLAGHNACICGDIVDELPLSQATVSQHLAELKAVGLITGDIDGPTVCYRINKKAWDEARSVLGQFLTEVKNCC